MRILLAGLLAVAAALPAHALTARLVDSEMTTTITGRVAWRCVYEVVTVGDAPRVERIFEGGCPSSIDVF